MSFLVQIHPFLSRAWTVGFGVIDGDDTTIGPAQSGSLYSTLTSNSTAVFYNLYLPFNKTEAELSSGYQAIREQIGQIASSVRTPLKIHYVNIGERINPKQIQEICNQHNHLTCHQKGYFQEGFEDLTLTELYNYCQEHPMDKVIYIHNKGSFHSELEVRI